MMKRLIALSLSAVIMLSGCVFAEASTEQATETAAEQAAETASEQAAKTYRLETKSFPWYYHSPANKLDGDKSIPLWFVNGVNDLPYMDLQDWADLMVFFMTDGGNAPGYELRVDVDDKEGEVTMTRENGFTAVFNFNEGKIIYLDYVAFNSMHNSKYMDAVGFQSPDPDGEPFLLYAMESRDRYGTMTVLNLKEYGIPMIAQDGKHLLPLQTLSTFFLFPFQVGIYFNSEALFFSSVESMQDPWNDFDRNILTSDMVTPEMWEKFLDFDGSEKESREFILETLSKASDEGAEAVAQYRQAAEASLYNIYKSVPGTERSDALVDYSYRELCLDLDCFYGLKDAHSISDFATFFLQTGLAENLTSKDAVRADTAIATLTYYWFDDGHSAFLGSSWMTDLTPDINYGFSNQASSTRGKATADERNLYPEATLPYYEVGDTAYVTFDEFLLKPSDDGILDYYALDKSPEGLPDDTIGVIVNAHRQITRENSPIKNVVLDLSCNGGGLASAATYTICWFLGEAKVSTHNTFTGSQSTSTYIADVNLDREFDDNDTLAGRGLNLYCLISPSSFSCGNLVPWAFKEDGRVTLLGKTSGGGSCVIRYLTTAWGTGFQLSGPNRLAFVKNGSYYDVDRGVEPDHIIDSYDHFYDRKALTDYIHTLF